MTFAKVIGTNSYTQTSRTVLHSTLVAASLFMVFIALNNAASPSIVFSQLPALVGGMVVYLISAKLLLHFRHVNLANWMLVILFIALACMCLLAWGLNAPIGIMALSYAVILTGILMSSVSIVPVITFSIILLVIINFIHTYEIIRPNLSNISEPASSIDALSYVAAIAAFGFITWVSRRQREKSLQQVLLTESKLQSQKEALREELEKESAALRLIQLEQTRELHKFALMGQGAAATLHELSTHLSVLNIDIDDLHQQNSNSEAIRNAKESIDHINKMVRKARHHLNSYDHRESFNALQVINQSIKDLKMKCIYHHVTLNKRHSHLRQGSMISGSPMALMQITTILLNNAIDACYRSPNPKVTIALKNTPTSVIISVTDTGPGVDPEVTTKLFKPLISSKPSGMGVGLYIARHLVTTQFNGTIELIPSPYGAHFRVVIPKETSKK